MDNEFLDLHIVAIYKHTVIGILLLKPLSEKLIKMRQVAVDSDFQGKGIGKEMVYFSEKLIKSKGYQSIELHARESAIPFYLSMNYKTVGDTFYEVGIAHKQMVKNLDS